MTLNESSIQWAIDFVSQHSDGDIFPKILEMEPIKTNAASFIKEVVNKDLANFQPQASRRFIVPKDEISYRLATQLHPQDSLLLSALVYQFGQGIEARRKSRDKVYSYRFNPTIDDGLYSNKTSWNDFWQKANQKSITATSILYLDIADFYNQIYHHTVENQLIESGFTNQATKWIVSLLESTTAGVSRGVPIGPHAIHLIAEATLIPVDNSLETVGLDFIRYADDIIVFFKSKKEATLSIASIATILDRQQRLTLQRHKTKIFTPDEFRNLCADMVEDRPIDKEEAKLLGIIRRYSGGNPYQTISHISISREDWSQFTKEGISKIINEYLSKESVDYIRLRWFYRRLAQVGHPGALEISLAKLDSLGPCFANICFYISSIQSIDSDQWKSIGQRLLHLLESDEVKQSEFFRLSILSLFTKNEYINHFSTLSKMYGISDASARREILLSAYQNKAIDWLREQKEMYANMDSWQKMAFIFCVSAFPKDEKKYFLNRFEFSSLFERILSKWAKSV